ncbi:MULTISPECIES: DUF4381 family protein [unclassified Lysobacter]
MQDAALVLRDIHQPPAPPWWPPAPGWWLLAALVVVAVGGWAWWARRRRRRLAAIAAVFDQTVAAAATPAAEVAAISELLRRAARRVSPEADRLQGDAWLELLDRDAGTKGKRGKRAAGNHGFRQGPGRLLLDGGYRKQVDPQQVAALRPLARARFLRWMAKS